MSESDAVALESDPRFPSGPWTGFFLQREIPGKHLMELRLTFRQGAFTGEGRDWVGAFTVRGRYSVEDGKCYWTMRYVGRHDAFYQGFTEGKGIWGTWEIPPDWRGGFHIWPVAMGDPSTGRLAEALEELTPVGVTSGQEAEVELAVD